MNTQAAELYITARIHPEFEPDQHEYAADWLAYRTYGGPMPDWDRYGLDREAALSIRKGIDSRLWGVDVWESGV